ncbi:MAG: diaminopimelate epimerase [Caldithrix sp.]|nr:diaminopimelate epimerase [Caldithrix sp.]
MKLRIDFVKIEATGNDFILIDGRKVSKSNLHERMIRKMCDRHLGIGADGLIHLSVDEASNNLVMTYYNADGKKSTMCGNGLRAATLFARINGLLNKTKMSINAADGPHEIQFNATKDIKVEIKPAEHIRWLDRESFELPEDIHPKAWLDTGVPHLICECDKPLTEDQVKRYGQYLRNHRAFGEQGANVNFIFKDERSRWFVRTYERGVEDETLSCGTGVTATSQVLWAHNETDDQTITLFTLGGKLSVWRREGRYFLAGPAKVAFCGYLFVNNEQS